MIIIHFSRLVNSDPCCCSLTSEPLADQLLRYYTGSLFAWVCRRCGCLGIGILVIFMTMTSLAGFWEEKRLECIISSLTWIEYNFY